MQIYDARYTSSDYSVFSPCNEISQDPVQFVLPKIRSNGVYRLDLAVLSLELKMVKASNPSTAPDKKSLVAGANNLLNSMWSRSALYLNNVPINASTQHHHYKAFLHILTTTSRMEKSCFMNEGYYYEAASYMDDDDSVTFKSRKNMFMNGSGDYTDHVRLAGFVYHDLVRLHFNQIFQTITFKKILELISARHSAWL